MTYEEFLDEVAVGVQHQVQDEWDWRGADGKSGDALESGRRLFRDLLRAGVDFIEPWQLFSLGIYSLGPRAFGGSVAEALLNRRGLCLVHWTWLKNQQKWAYRQVDGKPVRLVKTGDLALVRDLSPGTQFSPQMVPNKVYTKVGDAFPCVILDLRLEDYLP